MPPGVRDAILTCAVAGSPSECCGLLIGLAGRALAAWPARNVGKPPTTRYQIDPADHFAARHQARARGLHVVGGFHSHPGTSAVPSDIDRREALADFLYVIVGPLHGVPPAPMSGWRLINGNFVEIRLVPE